MPASQMFRQSTKKSMKDFETRRNVYKTQMNALRSVVSAQLLGVEIGVNSGRVIRKASIELGSAPCTEIRTLGIDGIREDYVGSATTLPFWKQTFDYAVIPSTISFVDDIEEIFSEAHRILKDAGEIIVGFIDANTEFGANYLINKYNREFYLDAYLYSCEQVLQLLSDTGFAGHEVYQTIFGNFDDITHVQDCKNGHGEGAFVIIKAKKQ
ncbi:MAG: methyltransferase domain-containing protein [Planctomycetes bacterium]|nr:methyltransferase domain-containing protein [Planctomycetota bacterium]